MIRVAYMFLLLTAGITACDVPPLVAPPTATPTAHQHPRPHLRPRPPAIRPMPPPLLPASPTAKSQDLETLQTRLDRASTRIRTLRRRLIDPNIDTEGADQQ